MEILDLIYGVKILMVFTFCLIVIIFCVYIEINYWNRKLNKKLNTQERQIQKLLKRSA